MRVRVRGHYAVLPCGRPLLRQATARDHAHDVAVAEWADERCGVTIDLTRDRVATNRGVNSIGEVERRRPSR